MKVCSKMVGKIILSFLLGRVGANVMKAGYHCCYELDAEGGWRVKREM